MTAGCPAAAALSGHSLPSHSPCETDCRTGTRGLEPWGLAPAAGRGGQAGALEGASASPGRRGPVTLHHSHCRMSPPGRGASRGCTVVGALVAPAPPWTVLRSRAPVTPRRSGQVDMAPLPPASSPRGQLLSSRFAFSSCVCKRWHIHVARKDCGDTFPARRPCD